MKFLIKLLNKKSLFSVIILLYLIPAFIQPNYVEDNRINGFYFGLPFTQTGDEPHYYVLLYSLVNDYDIFLTNNYNDVIYNNASWIKKDLDPLEDRHSRLFDNINKSVMTVFFFNSTHIDLKTTPSETSSIKEISGHPMGLPFFAFIFLWPFKHTALLESSAIFLTIIFSLLGLLAFYDLIMFYHKDVKKAVIFTFVLAFTTQYWHYSKTFWTEPYLTSFLIISWYLFVVRKFYFISGLLLGIGFLMKFPFLLIILPFYLLIASSNKELFKRIKSIIVFSIPLSICFFFALYLNYYFTNNSFEFNQTQAISFSNPFVGAINWLFSSRYGLFFFSPVLIFAFLGIRNFWRKNKLNCITSASIILLYSLFWFSYSITQNGAGGYSARYLVPLIPLICVLISFSDVEKSRLRIIFYTLLIISFFINFLSAFTYPAFIGYDIFTSFYKIIKFFWY